MFGPHFQRLCEIVGIHKKQSQDWWSHSKNGGPIRAAASGDQRRSHCAPPEKMPTPLKQQVHDSPRLNCYDYIPLAHPQ